MSGFVSWLGRNLSADTPNFKGKMICYLQGKSSSSECHALVRYQI